MAGTIPIMVVLEDDERRLEVMARLLAENFPQHEAIFFDNAPDMATWLETHLPEVALLCLDHDLGPSRLRGEERFEPGSGRDIADLLASRLPVCPVIVHTSNYHAAAGILSVLRRAGWMTGGVIPVADLLWLERDWLPTLHSLCP